MHKNSWDLLRLAAASMVLYSHQYALLGMLEPSFLGLASFGTVGVAIFFFLSGYLVWSSWERDPHVWRFFVRRALRILPALWVVCLLSVLVLGPVASDLSPARYFASDQTWRYLETALLALPRTLPGVFLQSPYPQVVNGSLWTLPLEALCYVSVALFGLVCLRRPSWRSAVLCLCLLFLLVLASLGPLGVASQLAPGFVSWGRNLAESLGFAYDRYASHFEMAALFWWGVMYGACLKTPGTVRPAAIAGLAILAVTTAVLWSFERTALLVFVALLVHAAGKLPVGAKWMDSLGDLSYGVYIVAFPVQQLGVQWGRARGWNMAAYFSVSFFVTYALAYASWHGVEKRALRFKPPTRTAR